MCGILFYLPKQTPSINPEKFKSALSLQRHRGPDDLEVQKVSSALFGFVRLSIVDLSSAANQPIQYQNLTLIINGELYNYLELKSELLQFGYTFTSTGDSEVFAASIAHWGLEEALKKFRGMWAAAVYNAQTQQFYIVRDRFGIKPLYYWETDEHIIFSSEIKSFFKLGYDTLRLKKDKIADFLYKGSLDEDLNTFYQDIYKVPPGHYSVLENNTSAPIKFQSYWDVTFNETQKFHPEALNEIIDESMKIHLRSDARISLALSGGVDSTIIANYARHIKDADFISSAHSSSGMLGTQSTKAGDIEKNSIDKNVSHYQLKHRYIDTTHAEHIDSLDFILSKLDEPIKSATTIYQYGLRKDAANHGSKVMLTGDGADEIFAGYPKCVPPYMADLITQKKYGLFLEKCFSLSTFYGFSPVQLFHHSLRYKKHNTEQPFLKTMLAKRLFSSPIPYWLRVEDGISSAVSLETRIPFLDHKLYEYVVNAETNAFLGRCKNKHMLRESMKETLPPHISNQTLKLGRPGNDQTLIFGQWKETAIEMFNTIAKTYGLLDSAHSCEQFIEDAQNGKNDRFWIRAFILHRWLFLLKEKNLPISFV